MNRNQPFENLRELFSHVIIFFFRKRICAIERDSRRLLCFYLHNLQDRIFAMSSADTF